MSTKEKIIQLRKQNKSYNEICSILNISKATVSYHCINVGLNDPINKTKKIDENVIIKFKEYYKTHTLDETVKKFGISRATIIKYSKRKTEKLTEDRRKEKNYEKVKNRRTKLKIMGVEYLGGKCMRCGYDKCYHAFDFHHRNPEEKEFGISRYLTLSWKKIKKELKKCDLLCANCHREVHYELGQKNNIV